MADSKQPQPATLAELLSAETDLAALSDEALEERRQALTDAIIAANDGERTSEILALAQAGGTEVAAIKVEQAERAEAAAALISAMDEVVAALSEAEPEVEGEEPAEEATAEVAEGAETEVAAAETEVETPPADPKEVSAAVQPKRVMNRQVKVPARQQPRNTAQTQDPKAHLIATGEVRGVPIGYHFEDWNDVNKAMVERWIQLRQTPRDGHPHLMCTLDYQHLYGPEQSLSGGDAYEVSEKISKYIDARRKSHHDGGEALGKLRVASGGVSGPAEPRYGQITFGMADRPLRDALPSFLAARGEIIFNNSPTLADVLLDTALGAIGTVTSSQDAAGATKDVQEISAPTPTTVVVQAETMRWSQGNFADRFYPERTQAMMALGQVAYARHNDALRLTDIKNACTQFTDTPAKFGAYRDLKRQFLGQTEELEDLVRDFEVPTICLMPEYVPSMMAADLVAQQAGDASWTVTEESMRAEMESWDPNVKFVWLKDSIRGRLSTSPSGQSPRSAGFDADVEWALFPDGAFLFLDGGQLDLGILRDTVVSATNKFQTFFESWEALAALVSSSLCFWMTSSLCSDGAAQLASAVNACSPQNS